MSKFRIQPILYGLAPCRHRSAKTVIAAALLAAGFLYWPGVPANAQVVPSTLALAAFAEAGDSVGVAGAAAAVIPTFTAPAYPPKPSRKEERMVRAERLYEEGFRLYQSGERAGARRTFDEALDLVLNDHAEPTNRSHFDKRFEELVQKIYRIDVDSLREDSKSEQPKPAFDKAPIDDILSLTFPVDPKLKPKVREEVAATVSQLPLEVSDAVLSFINYFAGERGHRTLVAGIKRAGKYKPMISRILDEEGIPQEFIFLAQAESGFLPRAVSYMAAGGMWQFIRGRGAEYGLRQNMWVDERFDPELATRAAARHLRDLYHYFGDWYLAIAAYNCGPGNVERAVEKTGYADVWELRSRGNLPLETSNYVPIILSMTIMSKNPKNYGLEDIVPDEPLVYDTLELNAMTSLSLISDILNVPVSELKELNPALLRDVAPSSYRMHIPRGTLQILQAGLDLVPADRRLAWRIHRAAEGESMSAVAGRYNTSVANLQLANPKAAAEDFTSGTMIVVPAAPKPVVTAVAVKKAQGGVKMQTAGRYSRPAAKTSSKAAVSKSPAPKPAAKTASRSTATRKQG